MTTFSKVLPYILMSALVIALAGCGKQEETANTSEDTKVINEQKKKEEKDLQSVEKIIYQADAEPMSNNPYNKLSYYLDGYTYIKEGASICRIADGSEDKIPVYTDENTAGMAFTFHKNIIYAYKTLISPETGQSSSEIIRINPDGSEPVSLLSYEGLTASLSFYNDDMYLWVSDSAGSSYKGYHLNEDSTLEAFADDETFLYHKVNEHLKKDPYMGVTNAVLEPTFSQKHYNGVFYREPQKTELPVWNLNFESKGKASKKLIECYGDGNILITPYGIYRVSEDGANIIRCSLNTLEETTVFTNGAPGDKIQLFTYDEHGMYFCTYTQDGNGNVYQVLNEDNTLNTIVSLPEVGITIRDQNLTGSSLLMNVQNGYVYLWSDSTQSVIKKAVQ